MQSRFESLQCLQDGHAPKTRASQEGDSYSARLFLRPEFLTPFFLGCQDRIQIFDYVTQLIAKQLMHLPQPAFSIEWCQLEVVLLDIQARRDVVSDHFQPMALLVRELLFFLLPRQPGIEVRLHSLWERHELVVLADGEA